MRSSAELWKMCDFYNHHLFLFFIFCSKNTPAQLSRGSVTLTPGRGKKCPSAQIILEQNKNLTASISECSAVAWPANVHLFVHPPRWAFLQFSIWPFWGVAIVRSFGRVHIGGSEGSLASEEVSLGAQSVVVNLLQSGTQTPTGCVRPPRAQEQRRFARF